MLALMLLTMPAAAAAPNRTEASSRSPIRTAGSGTQPSSPKESASPKLHSPAISSANTRRKRRSPRSMPTAPHVAETDWVQIVEWYDELLRFADTAIVRLNRAVAVGEADGAPAGLAALANVDEHVPRREAVAAYLHEKNGDLELAARLYANAARNAPNLAERDHQTRQAARLNQHLQHH